MSENFTHDVYLSHGDEDKPVVRELAERLKNDGLRVWFDEWETQAEEAGLERSRVLVLCMSSHAFGETWARLEAGTFRFRDPLNRERRFIPLRLDDGTVPDSLAQVLYIDWRAEERGREYRKLLEACRPPRARPASEPRARADRVFSLGHTGDILSVATDRDAKHALSGSDDHTIRLWDLQNGRCLKVLEGHSAPVRHVEWSPDGQQALSGSLDGTVRLWDVDAALCLSVLEGHSSRVWSVAWSHDGRRALSGSSDKTIRLWDLHDGQCSRVLEGHSETVFCVAWSFDGQRCLSGSQDGAVLVWNLADGTCLQRLTGHSDAVIGIAWSKDGHRGLSCSTDGTVRVWNLDDGSCLGVLEGHSSSVLSVAWSYSEQYVVSISSDHTIRIWNVDDGTCLRVLEEHSELVRHMTWGGNGRHVYLQSSGPPPVLWDIDYPRQIPELEGHSAAVSGVAWDQDGRRALSSAADNTIRVWDVDQGRCLRVLEGHTSAVWSVAWSHDGRRALSSAADNTVRVWDVDEGKCLQVLKGHTEPVLSGAWNPNGKRALSSSADSTIRLWDIESGRCLRILKGHTQPAWNVAWSQDGRFALSGSNSGTLRLWRIKDGRCLHIIRGHSALVWSVAWSPDGRRALSGSADNTLRLWDLEHERCLRVLEGHSDSVRSVAWGGGNLALSGSDDNTVRLWDLEEGRCLGILEGHSSTVTSVGFSHDGRRAFSASENGVLRVWDVAGLELARNATPEASAVQYTNAKVLLVGESGAGKTGLSMRLTGKAWEPSDSTVGAWATQWPLHISPAEIVEREIWLWDFGGQADQRLIHQLYMEDTSVIVLVFDGQKDNVFETLGQWDRDLARASNRPFTKLLAAGRVDAGGLRVSRSQMETFYKERGFAGFLETSAKLGTGCAELKEAILAGIRWENIPWRSSPVLFKRLKDEIVNLKDEGRVLMRFNELRDALHLRLFGAEATFKDEELKAVIRLLSGPGVVWELTFGSWILLQPERINAYAQAVIRTLRLDPHELGCLSEERVLNGDLSYQSSAERLPADEERFVLLAMHQTLVERGLCLREHTERGSLLVFPSYYQRERPDLVEYPSVLVSYRFNGFLDDIYATLVVRLHHTESFQQDQLWRYAADFKTMTGKQLGVKLTRRAEGEGELQVYFDPTISVEEKIIFSRYVHEHLRQKAQESRRLRHYVCPHCNQPVKDRETAMERLNAWLERQPAEQGLKGRIKAVFTRSEEPTIVCTRCEKRVPLWDELEEIFASPETRERVHQLQAQSDFVLDSESKDRALVGEVISTVALAGQISREFSVSDQGIDMEIEFKTDQHEATARKLYLQLKSGDSYLRERKSDGEEIFTIKKERYTRYWMSQAFPVLLVIRTSDGEVRWMEVRDYLKRESDDGRKPVRRIVFNGERFDVMSVRRWRDRVLV